MTSLLLLLHSRLQIENTAVGIRHPDHVAPSIRKSWHWLRRQAAVARSLQLARGLRPQSFFYEWDETQSFNIASDGPNLLEPDERRNNGGELIEVENSSSRIIPASYLPIINPSPVSYGWLLTSRLRSRRLTARAMAWPKNWLNFYLPSWRLVIISNN
jgi:hypothetical protein